MTINRVGRVAILALCMVSCASPLHPSHSTARVVSVFGDSERELDYRIAQARSLGVMARYVIVRAPPRTYHFPVYARLARDGNSLVVFAYRTVYVFALRGVRVNYNGWNAPVEPGRLPRIDVRLTATRMQNVLPVAQALAVVTDPWQVDPTYRPWRPIPARALHRKIERW